MRSFLLILLLSLCALAGRAQRDSLPYQKYPDLPAFQVATLNGDSSFNTFNIPKGKPVVLALFSPDCDHCEQQVRQIVFNMGRLRGVEFYLLTPMSMELARKFSDRMGLAEFPNVHVYGDQSFFYHKFYGVRYVPDFAIYDKNKRFVRLEEGKLDLNALMQLANR